MPISTKSYLLGFALAVFTSVSTASASNATYSVDLNKTEIVRLPSAASAVLIGNTSIADVSIHSSNIIFVVGRSYGETNLIILDKNGHTMMDANVQVTNSPNSGNIRVHNIGKGRETYSCAPYCLASPQLGDEPSFVKNNTGQQKPIKNDVASGKFTSPPMQGGPSTQRTTSYTRR
ncbi:MAG: pilus assembly protein N-terminal domain-containing protein [Maricaulaceae bacterium]